MELINYPHTLDLESIAYVDVRSPKEFKEATIPGAINIPIFNNEERAKIGTVYTQESPAKARMLGVEIVSPKLPSIVRKIKNISENYKHLVLFCSRGGMRSESIALVADMAGIDLYKLDGGYKTYRHFIMERLKNYQLQSRLLVIHGNTGVGKTELLYKLKEAGVPIIDLEGLANHRGSAFGSIGLGEPTNQKYFDSLLWEKLEKINGLPIIAVEAESKRIGSSVMPDFFRETMEEGIHILTKSSIDQRVTRIMGEYSETYKKDKEGFIDRALESITSIKKHIIKKAGKKGYQELVNNCQAGQFNKVIKTLLTEYYDPLYNHSQQKYQDKFRLEIETDDLNQMCHQIVNFIN
ncbi:tRNA 2-selenouridine(34) synthase MnmH [Halanaerocella petrolearia]